MIADEGSAAHIGETFHKVKKVNLFFKTTQQHLTSLPQHPPTLTTLRAFIRVHG